MFINISCEESRSYKIHDKDMQNSLPEGAVIESIRLVKFKEGTEYERLCLLIDFKYNFDETVCPDRTLLVVLKYNKGFKGNLIEHSARVCEYPTHTDLRVEYSVPLNSKILLCWLERQSTIGHHDTYGELKSLVISCRHKKEEYQLNIVLSSPDNYNGLLCKSIVC